MADHKEPACREWLGLEPGELPFPHRVVGVAVDERDALAIVRAADRRLAILRNAPSERSAERDALTAQVEAARDAMLAAAVRPPVPGVVAPPSVPAAPPAPPPVPLPQTQEPFGENPFPVVRRAVVRRHRSSSTGSAVGLAALVLAIAGLTLSIAWPQLQRALQVSKRPSPEPSSEPRPDPRPEPRPEPQPEHDSGPAPQPAPDASLQPAPDPGDRERIDAVVGPAITRAFAALRERDFATAKRELDGVAEAAHDDRETGDRLYCWDLLVQYATQYPAIRSEALANAADSTFEDGGRVIGGVGIEDGVFIYRDSLDPGRNLRFPVDRVPADVERIIVRAWLDAGDRAANHLCLGAAALSRPKPDLREARDEWQTAASKGEDHGRLLLDILDDPALGSR